MTETQGRIGTAPTHAELERAIMSVPGVAEASVTTVAETGRSRLRIRLANDDDAEAVSWSIAATLRERFGISLDPAQIRPRALSTTMLAKDDPAEASPESGVTPEGGDAPGGPPPDATDGPQLNDSDEGGRVREDARTGDAVSALSGFAPDGGRDVSVGGDHVLLSEAARSLLEDAVTELQARNAGDPDAADTVGDPGDVGDSGASVAVGDLSDGPGPTGPAVDTDSAAPRTAPGSADAADDDRVIPLEAREPAAWGPGGEPRSGQPGRASTEDDSRARIRHLDTQVNVSDVSVTATLGFGGREATGRVHAVATEQGVLRAVAEATLQALSDLTGERLIGGVDSVAASVSGEPPIATVIVSLFSDGGDEALLGSSLVRKDPQRAVMRATLDALNRRVQPWLEVDLAG